MTPKYRIASIALRGAVLALVWATGAGTASPAVADTVPAPASVSTSAPTSAATAATAAVAPPQPGAGAAAAPAASNAPPAAAAPATSNAPPADFKTLAEEVQGMKKDVIELNRDLFVLQEELLFPANTQVAVYVSMDVGAFFALDSVTLKIDNKEVKNYLYTAREAQALLKGGVQEIYLGNLKVGKHELVAFFTGKGPEERDYKRGAAMTFDKGVGAKYLELKITDRVSKHQPEFKIKDWE